MESGTSANPSMTLISSAVSGIALYSYATQRRLLIGASSVSNDEAIVPTTAIFSPSLGRSPRIAVSIIRASARRAPMPAT